MVWPNTTLTNGNIQDKVGRKGRCRPPATRSFVAPSFERAGENKGVGSRFGSEHRAGHTVQIDVKGEV